MEATPTIRPADGCLIDVDGTLYQAGEAIAGADQTLAALRAAGVPFRLTTNTTRKPRSAILARLAELGIEARREECITAPMAAAAWLRARGARRVALLVAEATREDFPGLTVDDQRPEYVVVGDLGDQWSYPVLNRAFRQLMAGATLVAIQRNRYWPARDGLALDAGAFVAALEYATGREAILAGKPSAAFFAAALGELGLAPARVAVVGDDLEADVRGAQRAGLRGVAVRTGKLGDGELGSCRPDAVLDSIAQLPSWLGLTCYQTRLDQNTAEITRGFGLFDLSRRCGNL